MDTKQKTLQNERYLRRKEAAKYVVDNYAMPCSPKTLAKIACVSSNGPPFRLAGRFPIYPISGLDAWAIGKIGPLIRSTAQSSVAPEINLTDRTAGKVRASRKARLETSIVAVVEETARKEERAADVEEAFAGAKAP